jgi:hypothetical protein
MILVSIEYGVCKISARHLIKSLKYYISFGTLRTTPELRLLCFLKSALFFRSVHRLRALLLMCTITYIILNYTFLYQFWSK